jgi:short-subunit dehydrogenase
MKRKKVIVVGATSGIGMGLARVFLENCYLVGITGRRLPLLHQLCNEYPDTCFVKAMDVTKPDEAIRQLDELVAEMGGLDILILNSGTGHRNEHLDFALELPAIQTNVLGFTALADRAFNYFIKQKEGHLAVVSSVAGIRGSRFAPAYGASKAYQINYMQALRQKAKKLKLSITVTDIRPGFVDTAMAQGDGLFWVASVEKAAQQIFGALKQKKDIVYITKRWRLVATFIRLLPRLLYERV